MIYFERRQPDPVRIVFPEGTCPFEVLGKVLERYSTQLSAAELMAREARVQAWRRENLNAKGKAGESGGPGNDDGQVVGRTGAGGRRRAPDAQGPALPDRAGSDANRGHAAPASGPGLPGVLGAGMSGPAAQGAADYRNDAPVGMGREVPATAVRASSVEVHRRLKASGAFTAQQNEVMNWILRQPGDVTRAEIGEGTGLKINVVCGRVHELLHGFESAALRELPVRRRCRVTGENVYALEIP